MLTLEKNLVDAPAELAVAGHRAKFDSSKLSDSNPKAQTGPREEPGRKIKFGKDNSFQAELRRRVEQFLRTTGRPQRDCWQMYLKSAIVLGAFAGLYVLLVFFASTWWQAFPLAILLGLATAEIGFNIQHDGGHQAYSKRPWINKLAAMTLDLIGGSSYVWHYKHAVFHHTYTNITGHDTDIDLGALGRLTPHQKRYPFHRWQHFYMWPLYGLLVINWHLLGDFREVITGKIGPHPFPRPKGWDLVIFIAGKATFVALAFVIPLWAHHSIWMVLLFYAVVTLVLGMVLSIVFQLAHAVEQAEFPMPRSDTGRIDNAWAIHETETTVDFARRSRVVAWLLGGLNFQIEHHLFPRICHINYPAISNLVQATCAEFGVRYSEHESFRAGMASHFRWLRRMGSESSSPETAGHV